MEWEIAKFVLQAAIAVGGAFLAAHLATTRFRGEKWWERKAIAYGELVDALHKMKWPPSEHMDAQIEGREIPQDESDKQWEEFKAARRNVWRIADGSSFLVSEQVLRAVQQMERDLGKATSAESWFEHVEAQYGAVEKCLSRIKEIGRAELGVKDA